MSIDYEIDKLKSMLEFHNNTFIERSAAIYDRIENLENKLNGRITAGRRHAIITKIDFYENELFKLHESVEILSRDINFKINKLNELKDKQQQEIKLKKESIDYNIEYLRKSISNKDNADIYEMFESLLNCVEILKKQHSR